MYTLSNILIQAAINGFGKDATSAWAAYGKIDVLFWMTMNSLGTAVTTFAGQNYGVGRYDRVRRSAREGALIALILTIPLSTFLCVFGEFILVTLCFDSNSFLRNGWTAWSPLTPTGLCQAGLRGVPSRR